MLLEAMQIVAKAARKEELALGALQLALSIIVMANLYLCLPTRLKASHAWLLGSGASAECQICCGLSEEVARLRLRHACIG